MSTQDPEQKFYNVQITDHPIPGNVFAFDVGTGFLWVAFNENKEAGALAFQPKSPIAATGNGEATSITSCIYEGQEYSPGSMTCQAGRLMKCEADGVWSDQGLCLNPGSVSLPNNSQAYSISPKVSCCTIKPAAPGSFFLYNSCDQCLIARINWTGTAQPGGGLGLKDYKIDPRSGSTFNVESSRGDLVDEIPCPPEFHFSRGTLAISFIDPSAVNQNEEVWLSVIGRNFRESSLVMVDAHFPATKFVSDTRLEAKLTKEITGTTGMRAVKVHDIASGDLSNEKMLNVEPYLQQEEQGIAAEHFTSTDAQTKKRAQALQASKLWTWIKVERGDCTIKNASFTLFEDGSTNWSCDISSTDSGDEWEGFFSIKDAAGVELFKAIRYHFDIHDSNSVKHWNEARGPNATFAAHFNEAKKISFFCNC